MIKKGLPTFISSLTAAILFIGCTNNTTAVEDTTAAATSGQLVDNYIANIDYICEDGSVGITDINGTFDCDTLPVEFSLGGLKLGKISALASDAQVFPQDLVGVPRADVNNTDVVAMARFLQSCDEDNNTGNGIQVREQVRAAFADANETFSADQIEEYATDADITLIDEETALEHLTSTTEFTDAVNAATKLPATVKDALLTPSSTLTQDVKNTIAFMGNEERLAYDTYNYLYAAFPTLTQFYNIATQSEYTHIQSVQLLAQKYITSPDDLTNLDANITTTMNVPIDEMQAGVYDIVELQNLYDAVIAIGEANEEAALKVGCMVEVTDIDDLLTDIQSAKDSNASDVVAVFEFLRDGSYSHYWSFDTALKNMGVADGCCDIGIVDGVDYCHPEYPQQEKGTAGGNGPRDGTGQQRGRK